MALIDQLKKLADLINSGELSDLFAEAGDRYVRVGKNIADTIQALAEEANELGQATPEEIAHFAQSVRHAINSVFLTANAAATKIKRLTGDATAQERVAKAAGEMVIAVALAELADLTGGSTE